jgi:hypothetical protein
MTADDALAAAALVIERDRASGPVVFQLNILVNLPVTRTRFLGQRLPAPPAARVA